MPDITPQQIMQVATGHWPARTLQVATKLGLFTLLAAEGGKTAEQIRAALGFLAREGFDYTGADFAGWCRDAGFSRTEVLPLAGAASAAIAYK